jgi:hypothetical protein
MNKELDVGDWVNSYSKGIYRIERMVDRYYEESSVLGDNKIGDKYKDRIIVTKRLLNSKFKKAISYESCSEYFISPLDESQFNQLNQILSANPQLLSQLDSYKIPTITTVFNTELQIDNDSDLKKIDELISFINNGKTYVEIQQEMSRLDLLRLKPRNFGNYGFQIFNYNFEYLDKRQIWRDARLYEK